MPEPYQDCVYMGNDFSMFYKVLTNKTSEPRAALNAHVQCPFRAGTVRIFGYLAGIPSVRHALVCRRSFHWSTAHSQMPAMAKGLGCKRAICLHGARRSLGLSRIRRAWLCAQRRSTSFAARTTLV